MMQSSRASARARNLFCTPAQVKTIHTIVSRLSVDDDTYRGMLSGYGVESCKDLMKWQAGELITALSNLGKSQGIKPAPVKKVYGTGQRGQNRHLTAEQADRIEVLKQLLKWDDARLFVFIGRQTGAMRGVQMLTNYQATKVIVGMQRVLTATLNPSVSPLSQRGEVYSIINGLPNSKLKNLIVQEQVQEGEEL
jgi:hypothetical protein